MDGRGDLSAFPYGHAMYLAYLPLTLIGKILSGEIGSIIGFMSGLVGIGGGIFLSPILFLMKAGYPKHITSTAS